MDTKFNIMKNFLSLLCLITAMVCSLLFTTGCRHCDDPTNPDCGNYNPCYGVSDVASFECSEYFDENTDLLVKCDTMVFNGASSSIFKSNRDYLTYDWQIGSDTNLRHGKTFAITFNKSFGTIPVTLIGKRAPNPKCIPNDDGVDTLTKLITIVDWKASPLIGRYTGSLVSNPKDTFTIEIKADHNITQLQPNKLVLINLFKNCDAIYGIGGIGYKQFTSQFNYFSPSGSCNRKPEIRGAMDLSNQLISITYTTTFNFNTWTNNTESFIGKRQP